MIKEDGLFQFYGEFSPKTGLKLKINNMHPEPISLQLSQFEVIVLGNPIVGKNIDKEHAAKTVKDIILNKSFDKLKLLNGEFCFLVINRDTNDFYLINDRFASIPIYYLIKKDAIVFSIKYNDLWIENNLIKELDSFHLFEFIWFTRLLGSKTLDRKSRFMTSATILEFQSSSLKTRKYWHPNFEKSTDSIDSLANELANGIKESLRLKTSDNPKAGLFLSGGIDSRMILSAFEKPPVCYTLAISQNIEFQVAQKIAQIAKSEHVYLQMPEDQYSRILKSSTMLGGGQYTYDHAIFLDYGKDVKGKSDVAFHGHGIDYMFQGMYLPISRLKFFGKPSSFTKLLTFPENPVQYFVDEVPYRTKYVDLLNYLKPKYRKDLYDYLNESVGAVLRESDGVFPTNYDQYEYLLTADLSRHYSNPNISSLMTYMEQRTVVFENNVFNLFHKIPPSKKLNGKLARKALQILNKEMANVITANTRLRASSGPTEKTLVRTFDYLYGNLRKGMKNELLQLSNQRTWPTRDSAFQNEPVLKQAALKASKSEFIEGLDIFNMDLIQKDINNWLYSPGPNPSHCNLGGGFMTSLVSINEFLSQ